MIDQEALEVTVEIAKPAEGFRARPYLCPAGVWTIGYGATRYLDGRPVAPSDSPVSEVAADRLLEQSICQTYQPGTKALTPLLKGAKLGAITDFSFNLGLTRLKASTLRKKLNMGDFHGAAEELKKWVNGGGRRLPGLVARRAAEIKYLLGSSK